MKLIYLGLLIFILFTSCAFRMPEIIDKKITVKEITNTGFTIFWTKSLSEGEIVYKLYILDDCREYYNILGNFVSTVRLNLRLNYQSIKNRYNSIVRIMLTDFNYFIVDDLVENTKYYVALIEWNITTREIRRYELLEIQTKSNDEANGIEKL